MESKTNQVEKNTTDQTSKQRVSDVIGYNELYFHQKCLYYLLYPLIYLLDIEFISQREWLQLPILTYFIEITQLMMAITFVQTNIQGLQTRAVFSHISADRVVFWMLIYTLIIAFLCCFCLYFLQRFTTKIHYSYFVELCTHLIGYGLLYLFVLIQFEWFIDDTLTAWLWFFVLLICTAFTIVFILISKQVLFDQNSQNHILSRYESYLSLHQNEESEMESLLISNIQKDEKREEQHMTHQIEMSSFWFSFFFILQNMWSVAVGFILTECAVYVFVGHYVNLLVPALEYRNEDSILEHIWQIILFGLVLAVCAAMFEAFIELKCMMPCYQFVKNNDRQNNDNCYHRFIVFMISWSNEFSVVWFKILAACIGWSLFPPNQEDDILDQFIWAILGTLAFVLFGVLTHKYKHKKQQKILIKINEIKQSGGNMMEKEEKIMKNVRTLMFFERMIGIYNEAFAVGASFVWESLIRMGLKQDYSDVQKLGDETQIFIVDLSYTLFIGFAFTQFGLFLIDLRQQRLHEIKDKENEIQNGL